jgi:hypothetical protein
VEMLFFLPSISKYSINFFYNHFKKKTNFRVGHSYPSNTQPIRRFSEQPLSYGYGQSSVPLHPAANIPQAPTFDADLITNTATSFKNRQPITENHTSYEERTVNNPQNNLCFFFRNFHIFLLFLLKVSVVRVVQSRLHTPQEVLIYQKYLIQLAIDGKIILKRFFFPPNYS